MPTEQDAFASLLFRQLCSAHELNPKVITETRLKRLVRAACAIINSRLPELSGYEAISLASEAVLKTIRACPSNIHSLEAYAAKAAANLANDQIRTLIRDRQQRHLEYTLETPRRSALKTSPRHTCGLSYTPADIRLDVQAATASLEWRPAMTTLAHINDGVSHAALAAEESVPTSTVSRRFHRDINALREHLEGGTS